MSSNAAEPVEFQALNSSAYIKKRVPKGKQLGAKSGHRKKPTFSKHHPLPKIEATKSGSSSKEATGSHTGHSKRNKKSSSAKDSNQSQPPASTPVVAGIHKEALQATGDPASLGVSNEERANPQLISVMSASTTMSVFSDSTILHSESTLGHKAPAASIAKADPRISAPNDLKSKQQGIVKRTKNFSFDHINAGTNPSVLVDKTKFAGDGLETAHTKIGSNNDSKADREVSFEDDEFNTSSDLFSSNDATKEIKLKDMSKLVQNVEVDFMDLDSPKNDTPIIIQEEDEEEAHTKKAYEEEVYADQHTKPEDASASQPPSPKTVRIQELSTHVHLLQTLNSKLLTKLLVTSLNPELSKLLTNHDFSESIPSELKELPSKVNDLFGELKELKNYVHELEIELLGDLKEIPTKLEKFNSTVSGLTTFAQAIEDVSHKAGEQSVPLEGQADTHPIEGEKNTRKATITQLFQ
ncbi:hypothetical protein Tco_0830377 [Tanacetum coccineum]